MTDQTHSLHGHLVFGGEGWEWLVSLNRTYVYTTAKTPWQTNIHVHTRGFQINQISRAKEPQMRRKPTPCLSHHITVKKKKTRSGAAKSQKESFLILVSAIKNSNSMICISFRSCKKDSFELEFCPNALWSKCEVYDHVVGKYFECKQWQLVSSLLSRVLTQPNNINKHDQWLCDSKGDLSNQIQKGGEKKTIFTEQFLNCPLHPSGTSTQTSENVVWKIGQAQTCNEYISWLAETYLNIISNELWNTLYFAHWK